MHFSNIEVVGTYLDLENVTLLKNLSDDILLLVAAELSVKLTVGGSVQLALVAVPVDVSDWSYVQLWWVGELTCV